MIRKTARKTLLDLADDWVPEIRVAFLLAIQDVTDTVVLRQVIEAIELGDVEKAFRALGLNDAAMRPLTGAIERAFENGGVAVGNTFPKRLATTEGVTAVFRFDVRDSRAERWLREKSASLVQTEIEHVRTSIRNVMTDGVTAGRNPKSIALDVTGRVNRTTGQRQGGIIGLTKNQERWAANVRLDLETLDSRYFTRELRSKNFDNIVKTAIKDGKPLPVETVNKLTGSYKSNALNYRGKVIGRTEALNALRQSNREAHNQAIDMGAANKQDVQRFWDATGDAKTRPDHSAAEAATRENPVGFDEPFVLVDGSQLMFPGDFSLGAAPEQTIQCRCIEQYVVDWTANLS
jgi:hypothetical protein